MEITITRKSKGTKTFFIPMIDGKRINSTNFARKYDAISFAKRVVEHLSK